VSATIADDDEASVRKNNVSSVMVDNGDGCVVEDESAVRVFFCYILICEWNHPRGKGSFYNLGFFLGLGF